MNIKAVCGVSVVALLTLFGSGCATNRGIIDVRVAAVQNPTTGPVVKIVKVSDLRKFELAPDKANIPSLKNGAIGDKLITSRAIARKRNGYGKALGDILLPEGRTVEALVKDSATKALKEKGYRVVEAGDAQYATALPITIDIHQFWAWMRPGFWALSLDFEGIVSCNNPRVFIASGEKIRGHLELKTQAAGTRAWTNILNQGLDALNVEMQKKMKPPK